MIELGRGVSLPLKYANRHGLIYGPTGTGKTVTIMRLADELSRQGVPVFLADVKGDLSAMTTLPGALWLDPYGRHDTALRATVKAMGPTLIARALELTDVQAGTLEIVFRFAAYKDLPFDTVTDLDRVCAAMGRHLAYVSDRFGHVTVASLGVVRRNAARLQGGPIAGPSFDVAALLKPGQVSVLDAERLHRSPRLYAAVMMHLIEELNERLPEIGDVGKPVLAFVFDEAHLLFSDAPPALLMRIEQTVRLIRSKGVGIYFASQSRDDIPVTIRNQLATVIGHDRKLGVGCASIEFIQENGYPTSKCPVKIYLPTRCALEAVAPRNNPAPEPAARVPHEPVTSRVEQAAGALIVAVVCAFAVYGVAAALGWSFTGTCAGLAGSAFALWRWGT